MRGLVLAAVIALAPATQAFAHAALVKAEPADGAVMPHPPAALTLTFNEPVSPLVIRLIGPAGAPIALRGVAAENATVAIPLPPGLGSGTHVLSWRVISGDGHPVGGAVIFSIGAPSAQPAAGAESYADPMVRTGLWAMKVVIYLGLFAGVGGAFFRAWLGESFSRAADPAIVALLVAGLSALPVSVGLQGLDVLELPLSGLRGRIAWEKGLETAYGSTVIAAALALFAGILTFAATSARLARGLSLFGLLAVGVALGLSGHASTVAPRLVSRAALLLHGVCVAFWIGALLPLLVGVRAARGGNVELARFSRAIPLPLALLVASGLWLVFVQLDRVDALWSTSYGQVLAGKLTAVALLLGSAAVNRWRLVPRLASPSAPAAFATSVACELVLAVAILALVALWRFTPPPRALAAPTAISVHLHGEKAMAEIAIARAAGQGGQATILVLDEAFRPLVVGEVTLVLANPAAGIEPVRRVAARADESSWRIDDLRVPVAGRWTLRVEILVSDFEKVTIEDAVTLPRIP